MTVLDEDIGADMASAEGVAGAWPPPETRSAEARCEELRRSELDARSRAGSLKSQLDKCRGKLKAAEEETKAVRRTAKNALALQAEVTRLEKLLSEAGVESGKRSTIMSLRMEVAGLRAAAPASEACRSRTAPRRSRNPEATIASLREATFVETPRYTGAVYRASGWTRVGATQGRGRYDRQMQFDKPRKDVWLRPLRKDWIRTLNR